MARFVTTGCSARSEGRRWVCPSPGEPSFTGSQSSAGTMPPMSSREDQAIRRWIGQPLSRALRQRMSRRELLSSARSRCKEHGEGQNQGHPFPTGQSVGGIGALVRLPLDARCRSFQREPQRGADPSRLHGLAAATQHQAVQPHVRKRAAERRGGCSHVRTYEPPPDPLAFQRALAQRRGLHRQGIGCADSAP